MSREMCYRCFWPKALCWCSSIMPIETKTKVVVLMHPKEYKHEKAATGRFTHLCLKNSEIIMGVSFDENARVKSLITNPLNFVVLLYPGKKAINISEKGLSADCIQNRQLVVLLLDGTWRTAKKMFNTSAILQALPRLMFVPEEKSRFFIKKQPKEWCLSTIEAAHELMVALEKAGLDRYERPSQMLDLFLKMQHYQVTCMKDPERQHYRPFKTIPKHILEITQ